MLNYLLEIRSLYIHVNFIDEAQNTELDQGCLHNNIKLAHINTSASDCSRLQYINKSKQSLLSDCMHNVHVHVLEVIMTSNHVRKGEIQ